MSDITIDQVTTTDPDESGVFDILMKSVGSHLDKQYVAGRIKGADYATVYLGALQAVLQQSIMFVLSEQKTEKDIELATAQIEAIQSDINTKLEQSAKDLEVKSQQIASMISDDLIKERQVVVTENQSVKDLEVKSNQIQSIQTDMNVKLQQSDKDLEVKSQQLLTEEQQTILIKEQHEKVAYETDNILPKQALLIEQQELTETQQTAKLAYEVSSLLPEQLIQLQEQIDLLQSQDLEVVANTARENNKATAQVTLLTSQNLTEVQQTRLVDANADKVEYEVLNLLPEQLLQLQEQVDLLQSQDLEVIASTARENSKSTAQVTLLGSQNLTEVQQTRLVNANADKTEYEVSTLLPQQYDRVLEEIDLLQSQDLEVLANTIRQDNQSAKELEVKDQQIASMVFDDLVKDNQIEAIQVDITTKLEQSSKELEVKSQQILSMVSDDLIKDRQVVVAETQSIKDLETKTAQIESMQTDMSVKLAQSDKDLELKNIQTIMVEHQIEGIQSDISVKLEQSNKDLVIKTNQANLIQEQLSTQVQQTTKLQEEIDLLEQQTLTEVQQTRLVDANADAKEYEVTNTLPKQALLLDQQKIQLEEQIDLLEQQYLTEVQQTAKLAYEVTTILPEQLIQLQEQIDVLQSQDLEIIASTTRQNAANTESIAASQANTLLKQTLGEKQADVYEGQAASFDKEAKFKVFKSLLDLRTTGMTQEMPGIKLDSESIGTDGDANSLANFMLKDVGISTDAAPIQNIISNDIIS